MVLYENHLFFDIRPCRAEMFEFAYFRFSETWRDFCTSDFPQADQVRPRSRAHGEWLFSGKRSVGLALR